MVQNKNLFLIYSYLHTIFSPPLSPVLPILTHKIIMKSIYNMLDAQTFVNDIIAKAF